MEEGEEVEGKEGVEVVVRVESHLRVFSERSIPISPITATAEGRREVRQREEEEEE